MSGLLTSCTVRNEKNTEGRIAAVVNKVEITNREVEYFVKNNNAYNSDLKNNTTLRRSILKNLVREELLAQEAKKMNAEKESDFAMAMYQAKRKILSSIAEAKIAESAINNNKISPTSVIDNNPRYFSERKLFVYDEIIIKDVDLPLLESLNVMAESGASLDKLIDELKNNNKVYNRYTKSSTSNQIQPGILQVLSNAKPNIPLVARVEDKFSMIIMLYARIPVPIEGVDAENTAKGILYAKIKNDEISKKMMEIINYSDIKYYGEYALDNGIDNDLPKPDKVLLGRVVQRKIYTGLMAFASCVLAINVLTVSKRILKGKLWLPKIWFISKRNNEIIHSQYDWKYEAYPIEKLYVFVIASVISITLIAQLYYLWDLLEIFWLIAIYFMAIVVGVFSSQIFRIIKIKNLSNKVYLFLASFITIPILICTMLIIR